MCDYSLQMIKSRPAQVGERLTVRSFGTGTNGFASSDQDNVNGSLCTAVCLLPGTELEFEAPLKARSDISHVYVSAGDARTARFTQVNKQHANVHHDRLELPDGTSIMLTYLDQGQRARVLQLPAVPKSQVEAEEQRRAEFV